MSPEDIKAVFGMQPEAAIAYLQQKRIDISWDWQDMLDDAHATAMLRLAPALFAAGAAVPASEALPRYIRDKVAQTTAERAAQRAGFAHNA